MTTFPPVCHRNPSDPPLDRRGFLFLQRKRKKLWRWVSHPLLESISSPRSFTLREEALVFSRTTLQGTSRREARGKTKQSLRRTTWARCLRQETSSPVHKLVPRCVVHQSLGSWTRQRLWRNLWQASRAPTEKRQNPMAKGLCMRRSNLTRRLTTMGREDGR